MKREPIVGAWEIGEFVFCAKKLALDLTSGDIRTAPRSRGRQEHRALEESVGQLPKFSHDEAERRLSKGKNTISAEVPLSSPRHGLSGTVDLLVRMRDRLHLYEYKDTTAPNALNTKIFGARCLESDGAQALGYGLLVEEKYKVTPSLSVIYGKDIPNFRKKMQEATSHDRVAKLLASAGAGLIEIPFRQDLRAYVEECIERTREIKKQPDKVRRNHEQPNKCVQCAQRDICPQRLG